MIVFVLIVLSAILVYIKVISSGVISDGVVSGIWDPARTVLQNFLPIETNPILIPLLAPKEVTTPLLGSFVPGVMSNLPAPKGLLSGVTHDLGSADSKVNKKFSKKFDAEARGSFFTTLKKDIELSGNTACLGYSDFLASPEGFSNPDKYPRFVAPKVPKTKCSLSKYIIGNGIEVYDDRLKFDEKLLVTDDMYRMNNSTIPKGGKDYENGLKRVKFVNPSNVKDLFNEQLHLYSQTDLTLAQVIEMQKKNDAYMLTKGEIKPSNAPPSVFDHANFHSNTYTPFSSSIGIHPVKNYFYQPKKNTLSLDSHFTTEDYVSSNSDSISIPFYESNSQYATYVGPKKKEYQIDSTMYKTSTCVSGTSGT